MSKLDACPLDGVKMGHLGKWSLGSFHAPFNVLRLFILFVMQALGIFEKSLKLGKFDESRK
jgi:hypothetical protein